MIAGRTYRPGCRRIGGGFRPLRPPRRSAAASAGARPPSRAPSPAGAAERLMNHFHHPARIGVLDPEADALAAVAAGQHSLDLPRLENGADVDLADEFRRDDPCSKGSRPARRSRPGAIRARYSSAISTSVSDRTVTIAGTHRTPTRAASSGDRARRRPLLRAAGASRDPDVAPGRVAEVQPLADQRGGQGIDPGPPRCFSPAGGQARFEPGPQRITGRCLLNDGQEPSSGVAVRAGNPVQPDGDDVPADRARTATTGSGSAPGN